MGYTALRYLGEEQGLRAGGAGRPARFAGA